MKADTVHLYREQHRDSNLVQVSRGRNGRSATQALAVQDNASRCSLLRLEIAISIRIKSQTDERKGHSAVPIRNRFSEDAGALA